MTTRCQAAACPVTGGAHESFGASVCAHCGKEQPQAPQPAPSLLIDPQAFRDGEALAYRRVLAVIESMQDGQEATRTRDEGRGVAHAAQSLRAAVVALIEDAGLTGEVLAHG